MAIKVSTSRKVFMTFNVIILVLLAVLCVFPFVNLLAISFSSRDAVIANRVTFWPVEFNLNSYRFILSNNQFIRSLWITVQRTFIGVPLNMLLIILTAYPLSKSKKEFRFRSFFSWFFVFTTLFHGGLVPTWMMVRNTGLLNSIWALILPSAVNVFNILVVMNYMRSLPKEMEEAALIDGAGPLQVLTKIILPVCKPTLATVALFSFVFHWNSWFDGMIYMQRVDLYPLQTYLQTMIINPEAFFRNATNTSAAVAQFVRLVDARTTGAAQLFLAILPIMCVYPFLQKYFAKGLVMGSVK
ncbi:MAG: carbohydrate ABC transporter permease [Turicibacter sp.]|nr:carbohydrate ABC transporter permease [Turicibacter sp.]